MAASFVLFPSGHVASSQSVFVFPRFKLRKSVSLDIRAGADNPESNVPLIMIDTTIEVDAEHFVQTPAGPVRVSKNESAHVIYSNQEDLLAGETYREFLGSIPKAEEFQAIFMQHARKLAQYHNSYRDAVARESSDATSALPANPLLAETLDVNETASPEHWQKGIQSRIRKMSELLKQGGLTVSGEHGDIPDVYALCDFLDEKGIRFDRERLTYDLLEVPFVEVTSGAKRPADFADAVFGDEEADSDTDTDDFEGAETDDAAVGQA